MNRQTANQTGPGRPSPNDAPPGPRRVRAFGPSRFSVAGLLVGLATLAVMLLSEPYLAIVWDEGYTLGRENRLRLWFQALRDPEGFAATWTPPAIELVQQQGVAPPRPDQLNTRGKLLFDRRVVAWFWPFAREEPHGHPPFYALVGLAGDVLAPSWADLPRARLGPILLFSLCSGALFSFVATRWGWWAAAVAAGAWVFQPNLFGHGHYASYDGVLCSLWMLAIFAFAAARREKGEVAQPPSRPNFPWLPALAFGLILGCAMADKLTGWFLPLPFLAWAALQRRRLPFAVLGVGVGVALAVVFLLNPPWWTEPFSGALGFFKSNLTRGQTIPIPVLFLGTIYQTPVESLPWYNTIVWTALVTPVGLLFLALAGVFRAVARRTTEPIGLLILFHWLFLLALRSLPNAPGHDGVRLFLPAFGLLAPLAGFGVVQLAQWVGKAARWAASISLAEAVVSVLVMMPVPLSYFSPIVGGLPGAVRLGMEPTYYWDALDADALAWLRTNTQPGQTIQFSSFPTAWLYLRETGALPPRLAPIDPGAPAWYVVQNRPGAWSPWDRALVNGAKPAYTVDKFGVPLVWIFPYQALREVMKTTPKAP